MSEVVELKKEKPTQLPQPQGYRLLIGMPEVEEKTSGGIYKTDLGMETETVASIVALYFRFVYTVHLLLVKQCVSFEFQ